MRIAVLTSALFVLIGGISAHADDTARSSRRGSQVAGVTPQETYGPAEMKCNPPLYARGALLASWDPKHCKESCKFLGKSCADYCDQALRNNCGTTCNTAAIIRGCDDGVRKEEEKFCRDNCSPFANCDGQKLSKRDRAAYLFQVAKKVADNSLGTRPEFAGLVKKNRESGGDYLAKYMVCVNAKRENKELEPVQRYIGSCRNPKNGLPYDAFGLGQVLDSTFYDLLGVRRGKGWVGKKLAFSDCAKEMTLKQIRESGVTKCSDPTRMMYEILTAGDPHISQMTPEHIYTFRAFNPDLQMRLMMATFLRHYLDRKGNWSAAWSGYCGGGCTHVAAIMACAQKSGQAFLDQF